MAIPTLGVLAPFKVLWCFDSCPASISACLISIVVRRFVPNRALGYVITIHSAHKVCAAFDPKPSAVRGPCADGLSGDALPLARQGHRLELGNPEFLSCEEYFVVRDEDVPCRATWTIWWARSQARGRARRHAQPALGRAVHCRDDHEPSLPLPTAGRMPSSRTLSRVRASCGFRMSRPHAQT